MHILSPDYINSEDYKRHASEFLRTSEAADYLHVSAKYLETARHRGDGPPWVRLGRSVRYMRADLDMFAHANKHSQIVEAEQQASPAQFPCEADRISHKRKR